MGAAALAVSAEELREIESSRASVHALVEKAAALGSPTGLIHAAGVSPSQASPKTIRSRGTLKYTIVKLSSIKQK